VTHAVNRRPYDATKRRRIAQQQRQQSRQRVITAAAALFAQNGYTATTIDAIAKAAGVAVQTVYAAVGGKPALMLAVVSRAVAGDESLTPLLDRGWLTRLRQETDPRRQIQILADEQMAIGPRIMPVWRAMRAAASSDPEVAQAWQQSMAIKYETQLAMVRAIRRADLKPGLTYPQAADLLWTLASPETYDLLVLQRGWPNERFARWLAEALAASLLANPG
jgi:AcrR family transcriptional regulator